MLVQANKSHLERVERLLERSCRSEEKRAESERREALDVLVSGSDSELEALEDYQFLARSSKTRNLAESARRLMDFERRLGDEDQARLALSTLESRNPTPVLEAAFDRALELTGEIELTLELYDLCERNQKMGERLLGTLEQVAEVAHGQNLAPLLGTWLEHPPSNETMEAAMQLAHQVSQPGWRPDDEWGVKNEDGRLVWSTLKHDSFTDLSSETVSLEGLTQCELHFQARHQFEDPARCMLTAREPRGSYETLATLEGHRGWTDHTVSLSKYSGKAVELEFERKGSGPGFISIDDVTITGVVPNQSQPFQFDAEGDWKELSTPRGKVWTDSPQGPLGNNVDLAITSSPVSLKGIRGSALALEAKFDLEKNHDICHVEVRSGNADWVEVGSLSGKEDWGPRLFDLAPYDGQEIEIRLRTQTDGSRESEGIEIADLRLMGSTPDAERVEIVIDGHRDDREQEDPLVSFLQEPSPEQRPQAYRAVADLAARTKEVGAALSLWPLLKGQLEAEDLPEQIEALGRLWTKFEKKTPKMYELLLQDHQPGDDIQVMADLLAAVGPDGFDLLRRRLQAGAPDQAGRNANLKFFAELTQFAEPEIAEKAFRVAGIPVEEETLAQRREMFTKMASLHGNLEQTTAAWKATTRWLGGEKLAEALNSYEILHSMLNEKAEPTLHAMDFIREHQMQGTLGLTLRECVDLMAKGLLSNPNNLDEALMDLLHQQAPAEIDIDEEGIQIGDTWIDTDYYLH